MIKIKALQGNKEFREIIVNPEHFVAMFPVRIEGELVDNLGTPQGIEKAMLILSTGQQLVVDTTVEEFFVGL